jgi:hypothetical protein
MTCLAYYACIYVAGETEENHEMTSVDFNWVSPMYNLMHYDGSSSWIEAYVRMF